MIGKMTVGFTQGREGEKKVSAWSRVELEEVFDPPVNENTPEGQQAIKMTYDRLSKFVKNRTTEELQTVPEIWDGQKWKT